MLIVCKSFSRESMSGLSAWRCVCDCINLKAIAVHSKHLMRAAQQKLLIWELLSPTSRYIHHPALTLELPVSIGPSAHSCPLFTPLIGHSMSHGAQQSPAKTSCAKIPPSGNAASSGTNRCEALCFSVVYWESNLRPLPHTASENNCAWEEHFGQLLHITQSWQ